MSASFEDDARAAERARANPRNVLGPFVLLAKLGAGGMGTVYRAWDGRLGRTVALKTLHEAPDEESGKRFAREVEALARFRHPNVVSFHESFVAAGRPCLVMDLVEGQTLDERRASLSLEERVRLVRDVALAVHAAHEAGIVHRDLKPRNVLVARDGRPVILDFGLSGFLDGRSRLTRTGAVLGTPAYAPPEQLGGEARAATPAGDVYSLGATLYEVLAGVPPFRGETELNVVAAVLTKTAPPPSSLDPDVPPALDAICSRCLAKDPVARYPSARAFAGDLDRFLSGEPLARGGSRRWPVAIGVVLGVALLSATAAVLGRFRAPPPPVHAPTSPPPAPSLPVAAPAPVASESAPAGPKWYVEGVPRLPRGVSPRAVPHEYVNAKDGSVLVHVPAGPFVMGADDRSTGREVVLEGYFVGKHEVTVDQFEAFVRSESYVTTAESASEVGGLVQRGPDGKNRTRVPGATFRCPRGDGVAAGGAFPASQVSWHDAKAYAAWAGLRLPSESEWEKAACWDDKLHEARRFPWGATIPGDGTRRFANVADLTRVRQWSDGTGHGYDDGWALAAPVGSFPLGASFYGVEDAAGNVEEWCEDRGSERGKETRVIRGGSFRDAPHVVRAAARDDRSPDRRDESLGFRVALSEPP